MFSFGKKKKEKENLVQKEEKNEIDSSKILSELQEKEKQLEQIKDRDRINLLNELGAGYHKINEIDKAIYFYEISLSESKEIGKAYTDLMKLYNIKRKAATEEKNDEQMKFYMNKIDELMKLSKDVIRGRA